MTDRRTRGPRRRIVRRIGLIALAAGLVALIGFVIWAENPMRAEAGPLAAVRGDPALTVRDSGDSVALLPRHPDGTGIVFLAGARVDAAAYAATFRGTADAGVTVVIARPILNFAIFEVRGPSAFETVAPGVHRWFVGGHSLGGVKACLWADGHGAGEHGADRDGVAGLILLGSYCSNDLSASRLPVLSIAGSRDGLSTPSKVAAARHLLPADARMVELPGADHAQFGAYGAQPGDRTATASDATIRRAITREVVAFVAGS